MKYFRKYTMVIALIVIWILFTFLTEGVFFTPRNLSNLFLQSSTIAVLATGMTLILVTGFLDLSVGSVAGFVGAVAALLQVDYGWSTGTTIFVCLAIGLLIGLWHGYLIAYRAIPAFIVTLASMIAFRGAIFGVTGGRTLGPMEDSFKLIGQGYLPSLWWHSTVDSGKLYFNDFTFLIAALTVLIFVFVQLRKRASRIQYHLKVLSFPLEILKLFFFSMIILFFFSIMGFYMGIPYAVLIVMIVGALFSILTNHTTFGRHLYAIGGNRDAARLSGINVKQRILCVFLLMGALSAVAGLILTARLNAATTSAGQNFELDAIAAAIIGGTSTMGGVGTVFGALIGALVMASLNNGMSLMNLDITWQYMVKGAILLVAVWIDVSSRQKN